METLKHEQKISYMSNPVSNPELEQQQVYKCKRTWALKCPCNSGNNSYIYKATEQQY
jgi:hypothetical protein